MAETKIDWADFSINPIKGLCPVDCKNNQGKSYCYARRLYRRFHWDETIRPVDPFYDYYALKGKPPCRVFIGSTMELFGPWVRDEWLHNTVFSYIRTYKEHTFILLTKRPENLRKHSPFPANCWVGVSVTDAEMASKAYTGLGYIQAPVKFVSYEPLLSETCIPPQFLRDAGINWVIIGQQTPRSAKTAPKLEWIHEIVEAGEKAGCKIFLKDNLTNITSDQEWAGKWVEHKNQPPGEEIWWHPRQELPKGIRGR